MRRQRSQTHDSTISGAIETPVTKENYVEKAMGWIRFNGGEGVVIRKGDGPNGWRHKAERPTDAQWRAWMGYWARLGVPCLFADHHGVATVPTEWPEDFDPETPPSDRYWAPPLVPSSGRNYNPDLIRLFRGLFRGIV